MEEKRRTSIAIGIALGVAVGTGIGAAMGNLALGIPIGMVMGLAIGSSGAFAKAGDDDSSGETDESESANPDVVDGEDGHGDE